MEVETLKLFSIVIGKLYRMDSRFSPRIMNVLSLYAMHFSGEP
jgi:hypothetical protein